MSIDELERVLPPPRSPLDAPDQADWLVVEKALGLVLPNDYKEFVSQYGAGCIDGFVWPFNPVTQNHHINLLKQAVAQNDLLRLVQKQFPRDVPYDLFPHERGLLPWAVTDNGDVLFWLKRHETHLIVVHDSRAPEWEEYDVSTTAFLTQVLLRHIVVKVFPPEWPPTDHKFTVLGEDYL